MLSQVIRRVPIEVYPLAAMIGGACLFGVFQLSKHLSRNPDVVVNKKNSFMMLDNSTTYKNNRPILTGRSDTHF